MAPLAARATQCWLRVRISTRFVIDGRVLTERFARRRAGVGDDYAYGHRSPPWGVILLTSHSMWYRVKTWFGSPRRTTVGLGLCNLLGDVIF
jgi:hypothetical protein